MSLCCRRASPASRAGSASLSTAAALNGLEAAIFRVDVYRASRLGNRQLVDALTAINEHCIPQRQLVAMVLDNGRAIGVPPASTHPLGLHLEP